MNGILKQLILKEHSTYAPCVAHAALAWHTVGSRHPPPMSGGLSELV